jgi:hypothetical protein
MFGVGTIDAIVVGGRSGGPKGSGAGMNGAALVTTEGAGAIVGLGGTSGIPGESCAGRGPPGCAWKK